MTVRITGQSGDLVDWNRAENSHGKGVPITGNAAAGEKSQTLPALIVDNRQQCDVELILKQPVEQARGNFELKVEPRNFFQPVYQRLGIQKAYAPNPKRP